MTTNSNEMNRREALKTTAKIAGVAAFATPVIVSTYGTSAFADWAACNGFGGVKPGDCTISDSDATSLDLTTGNRDWNMNCGGGTGATYGRYNANRSDFTYTGTIPTTPPTTITASLLFGGTGVDNFPVDEGWYTITATDNQTPPGTYKCTAYWSMKLSSSGAVVPACEGAGQVKECSTGGPANAYNVPYCNDNGGCLSNGFLFLERIVCCPV